LTVAATPPRTRDRPTFPRNPRKRRVPEAPAPAVHRHSGRDGRRRPSLPLRDPRCPTTLAISGEAHRDGQGYHGGRIFVMYTGSELSVAGFVRFIVGLGSARGTPLVRYRDGRKLNG
jgi:hypothetical protein